MQQPLSNTLDSRKGRHERQVRDAAATPARRWRPPRARLPSGRRWGPAASAPQCRPGPQGTPAHMATQLSERSAMHLRVRGHGWERALLLSLQCACQLAFTGGPVQRQVGLLARLLYSRAGKRGVWHSQKTLFHTDRTSSLARQALLHISCPISPALQ